MHAKKLFDSIEIPIIFMMWLNLHKQTNAIEDINQMIDFLTSYNLKPYSNSRVLDINKWLTWPGFIFWRHDMTLVSTEKLLGFKSSTFKLFIISLRDMFSIIVL